MKLVVLFILLLTAMVGKAQTFTSEYINYHRTGLNDDCGATVIDYNNDGIKDVLFGFEARNELMSLTKNHFDLFKINILFDTISGCSYLKTFDYDQDGDDDLLANLKVAGYWRLYILQNNGVTFDNVALLRQSYELIYAIEMLDIDLDGDFDFMVDPDGNNNSLETFIQNSPNSFSTNVLAFTGQPAILYAIADFDNDSYQDALVSYFNFTINDYIYGIYHNVNGTFNFIPIDTSNVYLNASVGDFNHDGKIDFVAKNVGQNLKLYLNNTISDFTKSEYIIGNNKNLFPSIDYDNDGYLDISIYNLSTSNVSIYTLVGTNLGETLLNGSFYRIPIAYADMNNDGKKDFVCSENGSIYILNYVSENNYQSIYTNYFNTNIPAIYDRNNNGKKDVCLGQYNLLSFKDQHFSEFFHNIEEDFLEGTTYDINTNLSQIIPFDKNNDGVEDLLVRMNNELFWITYDENNNKSIEIISTNFNKTIYWVGDLDYDNKVDILSSGNTNYQRIERNNANSYTQSTINASLIYPFEIGDIDNDNDLDYISFEWDASLQKHFLVVGRNQGNQNFTHERQVELSTFFSNSSQLSTVNNAIKIVSTDTDNDGDIDAFIQSPVADKVLFLENDGTGLYSGTLLTNLFDSPQSINAVDMNNDGFVDLILSNHDDGQITILTNNQNNTFNQTFLTNNIAYPEFVKVMDFDTDGDLDIITVSVIDQKVVLLKNQEINCERSYSESALTICSNDSVLFNNNYISNPGLYFDTITGSNTCDSIHALTLSHFPNLGSTQTITKCVNDSILFNGFYLISGGVYYDTLQNVMGCDSLITLQLNNFTSPTVIISQIDDNLLCSGTFSQYNWYLNGQIIPNENSATLNILTYGNGSFHVEVMDNNSCLISSGEFNVNNVGLSSLKQNDFTLFPNPVNEELNLSQIPSGVKNIEILSIEGKSLLNYDLNSESKSLCIDTKSLSSGIYFLKMNQISTSESRPFVKR